MEYFKYITPFIYIVLSIIWSYVFFFYIHKIVKNTISDKLLKTLLAILAIDSFRTLFESLYFGLKNSSQYEILPIQIFHFLNRPEIVFIPKAVNLIVAFIVLSILLKKWIPAETSRVQSIDTLIKMQNSYMQEVINNLNTTKEELNKSKEDYENRFIYFPFPVFIWQKKEDDFEMVTANNAAFHDSNGKIKNVFGIKSRILWKDEPELTAFLNRAFDNKSTFSIVREYRFRATDISKFVSATYSYLPPSSVQIVTVDISEQKKAENNLIEQKLLFETMFNTISDGVIITNVEREIILANKAMTSIFGYTNQELVGKSAEVIYSDKFNFTEAGRNIFNKDSLNSGKLFTTTYKDKNNEPFQGETFGAKLFDNHSNWIGNLAVIRNITERVHFIDEIKKAKEKAEESNMLKSEFMSNMSHEIRTPMNGILGFSSLLSKPNLSDEKQQAFIEIIQRSGNQLLRIIDDILEISELVTKQIEINENEICLNTLLSELFTNFADKAKENNMPFFLRKAVKRNNCLICADDKKIIRIISILLENALKFTKTGFVKFGYYFIDIQTNEQVDLSKATHIEFYVEDTGIGIAAAKQEIIFERFSQAEKNITDKVGGLGLGLSIAKEYTLLLGGKIFLSSELGKGSTFYVQIPYKSALKHTNIKELSKMEKKKHLILVAEDEEINYLYIETLLEDELDLDFEILRAKNGLEAVKVCENNEAIELVLMDIKMPKMNGNQATQLIRNFRPHLPIVAQTAFTTDEDRQNAFAAGCSDFIAKPIGKEMLFDIISKYLNQ